jgi:hypothetical protein
MSNHWGNEFAVTAPETQTVTLTGILCQTDDPSTFGLILGDGRSVKFDVATVKSCLVLCSSVGERILRFDLDASQVVEIIDQQQCLVSAKGSTARARNLTNGGDPKPPKDPIGDTGDEDPINDDDGKPPKDPIGDTGDEDVPRPPNQSYVHDGPLCMLQDFATPFSLVTPRQAISI